MRNNNFIQRCILFMKEKGEKGTSLLQERNNDPLFFLIPRVVFIQQQEIYPVPFFPFGFFAANR